MTWTTLPSAGSKLRGPTLSTLFTEVRSPQEKRGCRLRRAANQSINNNSTTLITWDTEDEDTDGYITVSSDTITIPTGLDGMYSIAVFVNFPNLAAATRIFGSINAAGSIPSGMPGVVARQFSNTSEDDVWVGTSVYLPAGSTITVDCFHNEGSAQNVTAWMSCYRTAGNV